MICNTSIKEWAKPDFNKTRRLINIEAPGLVGLRKNEKRGEIISV